MYDYPSISFADANTGYAAGMSGKIIKTIDGGNTWTVFPYQTNNYLNSIIATDINTVYVAGNYGTIMKTSNGGGFVTINDIPKEELEFSIYPNPAKTKVSISIPNNKTKDEIIITILNIQGELLLTKKFRNMNLMEFELSGLTDGIYLFKIQTETGIETQKLIIQ
jgi:hypothetical protein